MLTRRNLWIIVSGSIAMAMLLWFGSYKRNYQPDIPQQYGVVPSFSAMNIKGEPINLSHLMDHITAVSFFSRSCPATCQESMLQMSKLQKLMRGGDGFRLLTIGLGFKGQSGHLAGLVERLTLERSNWNFVIESEGAELSMLQRLKQEFPQSAQLLDSGAAVALIGRSGEFRGVYDVQDKFEAVRLQNHTYNLVVQPKPVADLSQRIN